MASRLYDSFNRNGTATPIALGLSDSGHTYGIVGTVQVQQNAARVDPAPALSVAVLDAGANGGDGELGVSFAGKGAGLAAYFRWVDSSNWWRAYQRVYTYQYQTGTETYVSGYTQVFSHYESVIVGYTPIEYQWRRDYPTGITHNYQDMYGLHYETSWSGSSSYSPFGSQGTRSHLHFLSGIYYPGDDTIHIHDAYNSGYYTGQTRGGDPIYEQRAVYTSQPIYSTRPTYATATGYDLRLERMVAGALSTRAARQITGPFSRIRVALKGDKIDAYVAGVTLPVSTIDTTHQGATRHGFGRGKPSELEDAAADLVDDFIFTPLAAGSLMPPILP